ncbi:Fructosamine kinase-domain-containing protein [Annulohypoxylon nitens]|nr:Fructosamine kinase-domain-containing protein [Annulohypoxylon nitens]
MDSVALIDHNVFAALLDVSEILETKCRGESAWAKAIRVRVLHKDGREENYFMKVSVGDHGREALKGEFESTSSIYSITPDFCPKPIACGTFASDPSSHFYICKFYDFVEGVPEPTSFCEKLARLHSSHTSPNDGLLPPLFNRVIPRLLRPLESEGRIIQPSLVHGDLCFWAHNEYELGNWRPERNKFTRRYYQAYHSHIPKSEPQEDYDDRNALYSL